MKNSVLCASSALLLVAAWAGARFDASAVVPPADRKPETGRSGARVLEHVRSFLQSLGPDLLERVRFAFDEDERYNWHFFPRERKGVPLRDLDETQKARLHDLLASLMSVKGVETMEAIRKLEGVLRETEGGGGRFARDPELYFASIFGEPSSTNRWGLRFEGHHLSVNITLEGPKVLAATPLFLGANPAIVRKGPHEGLRVLAGVEDVARELVSSLDEEQLGRAMGKGAPAEIVGMGSRRPEGPWPAGLETSRLSPAQGKILRKLVAEYTRHLRADVRAAFAARFHSQDPEKVQFVWRGSRKPFEGHSYIIHGPLAVIAYANFQNGAAHVHSVLRDPEGDFGPR